MNGLLKILLLSLSILGAPVSAMEIIVDPSASGSIASGGLDLFENSNRHQTPLSRVSFYDVGGGCMPSQCGSAHSRGYTLFDGLPSGFSVQSAAFELDVSRAYFFPFTFMGIRFPNGSGSLSIHLFNGALVEALRTLPEGELSFSETAPSELAASTRSFMTRSTLLSSELSAGTVRFDLTRAAIDALNENPGPFGLSLELRGVVEGFVSLSNPGRLILDGEFAAVSLPATLPLLMYGLGLLTLRGRAKSKTQRCRH